MDKLEKTLKSAFVSFGFRGSHRYRATWIEQVQEIGDYWEYMMGDVKVNELMDEFSLECTRANFECDRWEIIYHLKKAITDWKIELMTEVANRIVQLMNDKTEGDFVRWIGFDMLIINIPDVLDR